MSLEPPEFLDKLTFDKRRTSDAQGVIDDLLKLIALQAAELHDQRLTTFGRAVKGGDVRVTSSPKKPRGKAKGEAQTQEAEGELL